jgi:hypothetical protein
MWQEIADAAARESPLWADALLPRERWQREVVFSRLAPDRHAVGIETIYEGYLAHYGTPRLFAPRDADTALLLGDYLYAQGLVRVAETGDVPAVADLADLISLCAQGQADGRDGDGAAWAATASLLGRAALERPRTRLRLARDPDDLEQAARTSAGDAAVDAAFAAHALLVG